ncbi:unnamed protein product [Tetraodon nigroviridis]|uniref:(spotted green pufferfish) hypothetical protein n=1 Tax=Tetraodon nigroviridis TaxID=99883 RepID=Q4SDC2_TETNG|nr:unnamed protein product [Tetraodon nigroviridis]
MLALGSREDDQNRVSQPCPIFQLIRVIRTDQDYWVKTFFVVFTGVNAVWVASDMAIDFRFPLLTGEDAEIAIVMQGQPKGLQGKGKDSAYCKGALQVRPAATTLNLKDEEGKAQRCFTPLHVRLDSPWPPGFSINIHAWGSDPTGRHVLCLVPLSNQMSD